MVRSGPSGSVVHGGPRTEPAGDTRRRNIFYDFGFHLCLKISEKINEAIEIGANNDYRKREIIVVLPACIRARIHDAL